MTSQRKNLSAVLKSAGMGIILAFAAIAAIFVLPAIADGPDEATVVVQFNDEGSTVVRDVNFTGPASGLDVLMLTGLDVITADGGLVCSIGGVGCPADNCWCAYPLFWNYNSWDGASWQGYDVGAVSSEVNDGAVEGYRWGEWGAAAVPYTQTLAAQNTLDRLHEQQQANGGFGSEVATVDSMLAMGANQIALTDWFTGTGSVSLPNYWDTSGVADNYVSGVNRLGKLAMAVAGVQDNPQTFDGVNLAADLVAEYNSQTGAFGATPNNTNQAYAILGWRSVVSRPVPARAVEYLANNANADGGWSWSAPGGSTGSDTNSTSVAVQALIAGGVSSQSGVITRALAYLKTAQNTDGGFNYDPNSAYTDTDVNSTASVVQALIAAGQDPVTTTWTMGGKSAIDFLLSAQLPNGGFEWQSGTGENLLATQQAVSALLQQSYPYQVVEFTVISTTQESTLTSSDDDITISVPAGTFAGSGQISIFFDELTVGATDGGNIGILYELSAYNEDGDPAELEADKTYTVTVSYADSQGGTANLPVGFAEKDLALYYWNGSTWVKEPTSVVDTVAKTITATPNHFSLWGAMAFRNIFLPVVLK